MDVAIHCAYDKLVRLDELRPNPANPNTHPENQIKLLAHIIREQGWRAPITVSTLSGYIVRGHGRLEAAKYLGLEEAPVDFQDYPSEAAEYADLIADNRLAELAEMDAGKLRDLLQEIDTGEIDMLLTGFDEKELEALMVNVAPKMGSLADLSDMGEKDVEQLTLVVHLGQAEEFRRRLKEIASNNPDPGDVAPMGWAMEQALTAYERLAGS